MTGQNGQNSIRVVITDIFQRYASEAPEDALENIERRAGLNLTQVNPGNLDDFLEAMRCELMNVMDEWKTKFVTGVIKQMVVRSMEKEE